MDFLATIAPLEQAVKHFGEKSVVASTLRSKGWSKVPAEIADRAFFSAGVEDARFLAAAQEKILAALKLQRERVARGEALADRSSFIGDMRKLALPLSDSPNPFADQGVTNIASRARLGLIYDMQTQSAQGFADFKTGMDPDLLDAFPAQELLPSTARQPRTTWEQKWTAGGGRIFGGRMVALKTDGVWSKISRFGTPWAPFDFGSTRELRDVSRQEAEDIGLLKPQQRVEPAADTYLNEGLAAPTSGLPGAFLAKLRSVFGDRVAVADGQIAWRAAA